MRIYLAAPLFTQVQRAWNRALAQTIVRAGTDWEITLPQDFRAEGRFNDARHYPALFRRCLEALGACHVVLAVLDGADVDSGTAFELGYARALGKSIVGLRTDYRPGADHGVNLMCARACDYRIREFAFQENPKPLADAVVRRLHSIARQREARAE